MRTRAQEKKRCSTSYKSRWVEVTHNVMFSCQWDILDVVSTRLASLVNIEDVCCLLSDNNKWVATDRLEKGPTSGTRSWRTKNLGVVSFKLRRHRKIQLPVFMNVAVTRLLIDVGFIAQKLWDPIDIALPFLPICLKELILFFLVDKQFKK